MRELGLIIIAIMVCHFGGNAQNINVSGNITANTVWDAASIDTVKITGNTTIDSLVVLTIEPGIVIDFTDNYFFNVKGRLLAEGTSSDLITFTTSDTTGFSTNSHHGWSGIRIHDRRYSSDTIVIDYCNIEYGKADGTSGLENSSDGGGLYIYSNFKMKVSHTTFKNNYAAGNGGAMYDYYSFTSGDAYYQMIGCYFINNTSIGDGGAIYTGRSVLDIYGAVFENNTSVTGKGGAIKDGSSYSYVGVYNSKFSYNKAVSGGAICFTIGTSSLHHKIKHSFFNNNEATAGVGGALFLGSVNASVQNSVFVNNEASDKGGAVYTYNLTSDGGGLNEFANNTLAHNKALEGGGLYVYDNIGSTGQFAAYNLYLNKVVFYNNESITALRNKDLYLGGGSSNGTRVYACSFTEDLTDVGRSTASFVNQGNLHFTDPLFVSPSAGVGASFDGYSTKDWSLGCSSTCADVSGTVLYTPDSLDYNGGPRDINGIDIGAYESYDFLTLPSSLAICEGDTAAFSATFYAPNADLANSWWSFSPDGGANWYADQNYSGDYVISTNTPYSYNGYLIRLEIDLGCGLVQTGSVILIVRPKGSSQELVSTCDSLFVGGAWQSSDGSYYDTLQTTYGCDSIVETVLTVNSSYFSASAITICQGDSALIFGNNEYTTDLYYDSLQTTAGCDSVYHVQLTVNPIYFATQNQTICSNDSLFVAGSWQNTAATYYDTLQTVGFGCDSIIETVLTVNQVSATVIDTSFCAGNDIVLGGVTYTQGGTFVQNYTNFLNCDSTVTYNLTESLLPNANIGPDTLFLCGGEDLSFGLDDTTGIVNYSISNFSITENNDSLLFTYNMASPPSSIVSQVTDTNGCVNNDQVYIENNNINFLAMGFPSLNDPYVDFTIANMPNNVDSWYWNFGDGDTLSVVTSPTHEYLSNGVFEACLVAENVCGKDSSCATFTIVAVVGVEENNISNNISIYPNPAQNQLTIKAENLKIEQIVILDVTGKEVRNITQNLTEIDISDLQKGIYFVKIYTDKGVGNQRIIKN